MLTKRLVACFDVVAELIEDETRHEITVCKQNVADLAREMYEEQIDELYIYDKTASESSSHIDIDVIKRVAEHVFVPLTVGGGIRDLDDMFKALKAGAEKISINTQAVKNPKLIEEGAKAFGVQCILLTAHVKKTVKMPSGYEVYIDDGRTAAGLDAIEWLKQAEQLGAGEVCLRTIESVGKGGSMVNFYGFDAELIKNVESHISMPLIASCTAASPEQIKDLFTKTEAGAAIIGSSLHPYRQKKDYTVAELKKYLIGSGIDMRPSSVVS